MPNIIIQDYTTLEGERSSHCDDVFDYENDFKIDPSVWIGGPAAIACGWPDRMCMREQLIANFLFNIMHKRVILKSWVMK